MMILGVDPGLHTTGYGLIETGLNGTGPVKLVEAGIIEPRTKDVLPERVNTVYRHLSAVVGQFKPDVMVLEKLYSHYRHPATACILGHARGVVCLVCAHHNLKLEEHSVKRIRKAVVGNGNATKHQTRAVVGHLLGVDARQLTLDASDALALALGYARMNRL